MQDVGREDGGDADLPGFGPDDHAAVGHGRDGVVKMGPDVQGHHTRARLDDLNVWQKFLEAAPCHLESGQGARLLNLLCCGSGHFVPILRLVKIIWGFWR